MSLRNFENEVQKLHLKIKECAKNSTDITSLYKGCQIWFSPIIEKPKVLLIGFNPGAGFFNWEGRIVEQFEPLTALEYYLSDHTLANQTKKLFQIMENEDILKHQTVKSNFYFFATSNVSDFKKLTKLLPQEITNEIFHLGRIWTKQIIDTLKPNLILCEGMATFNEVSVLFDNKVNFEKSKNHQQFQTAETTVFAYKRNQGSIIEKNQIGLILKNHF